MAGKRVLVAEDEYNIAMFLVEYLQMKDVDVVGPAGNLKALDALVDAHAIDGALLDINLGGELVYPLADRLLERNIPFVLTSGYDDNVPERFADAPRCGKPYRLEALTQALEQALQARGVPGSG
nr:response regulator [Stenotrophomonas chelatiphaga]